MESRPRSVLAAFQEHLQIASTKCGSLMEQLNIVRKKVEGKEAMMNTSDPVSDDFLENVSQKTVLQSEGMDFLDHKDVHYKEQMAVGNAYVDRSTEDKKCDVNIHLMVDTSSQHSEILVNNEGVPFTNGNFTSDEKEKYSLKSDDARSHKRSEETLLKETEKISGKERLNDIAGKEKEEFFNQDVSSDDESLLSSLSSSDDDCQEAPDKQNIYEELLKRLKINEEKKNINKNRTSSENSSSISQKTNKSRKKNSSNSTINEDILEKKHSDIENLNAGVDFFLPTSVTEKFQEMYYEDSGEEEQNNANKDKSMRITFDDLIVGRPNKHSIGGEIQNRSLNKTTLKNKVSPNQSNQQISNHIRNDKAKEKLCDTSSVKTKSEKSKKPNTTVCSSAVMNFKFHSPEMNLYKRLTGVPLKHDTKKTSGKKDIKSKKTTLANSRLKSKHIVTDSKLKILQDKKNIVSNNLKITINEAKSRTLSNANKDVSKNIIITNKIQQKSNTPAASNNLHKTSGIEIIPTNYQSKQVEKAKLSTDGNIKRGSLDEIVNCKEEIRYDKIINSDSKNLFSKKDHASKKDELYNLKEKINLKLKNLISKKDHANKVEDKKEKHNLESKNLIPKKNHVITVVDQGLPKEKLAQPAKFNTLIKEKRPAITKIEHYSKNNVQTLTTGKELSSVNSTINDEIPSVNMKLKNNKERLRPNTSVHTIQPKKEWNKHKLLSARKEDKFQIKNLQSFDKSSKTKEPSESLKGRQHFTKETIHSQSLNEMKNQTTPFPFILGQSTSKTYNVRAAIQQTMSMIMRSPAETLRRSSFSEMLNVSSKASTLKTSASTNSGRKVCPACVMRIDEEDCEVDDNPIDPWDTEYHSKRFIRCTCMPRNTVNFKTVMNQLLHETNSSYILPTESYQDSELENGEDNRVKKVLFRKNNNIYKLSKLLHTLLKIRDLLVT